MTAIWLRGMGHNAVVLDIEALRPEELTRSSLTTLAFAPDAPEIDVRDWPALQHDGGLMIDLDPSMSYRKRHLAGSVWGTRARLNRQLAGHPRSKPIVVTASDPRLAALAVKDIRTLGFHRVFWLSKAAIEAAGESALSRPGTKFDSTPASPPDADCIDYLFFVHDRHDGNLEAARNYLAWEVGLMGQMDAQERGVLRPLM